MATKEEIIEVLKKVNDPEINANIWELGLVYEITPGDGEVDILMTFTSPMCPVGPMIIEDVKRQVGSLDGVQDVKIEITFDPPWGPDKIAEDLRVALGIPMDISEQD